MKACSRSHKYDGKTPPLCNGSQTCETCLEKWQGLAERAVNGTLTNEDLIKLKDINNGKI